MRICEVYIHDIKAGILTETDSGEYIFKYDLNYVNDKFHEPISLTMPIRK
jgi:HipA-like protein